MLFFYLNLTTCIIIIISTAVKDIKKYRMAPTYFLLSFLDAGFIIISYIVNIISLFTKPALGGVLGLLVLSLINKHTVLYLHAPIVDNNIYSISIFIVYSRLHPNYFIPFFFMASSMGGTSSDLQNILTMSTCSGTSDTLEYDFLPRTSVAVGFTGMTLYPFSIRYFWYKVSWLSFCV